jgi:hypothetical protein
MTPKIYWNNRGDFKKAPRYCAINVKYGADWIVNSEGEVRKNRQYFEYLYLLGKEKPRYPVPAVYM